MGPVGVQEMVVILLVALVLFGPKKLPELGRTVGKAITEFRRAQSELKATFETHMRELEKESQSIKEVTRSYTNDIYNHYTGYDSSYYDSGALGASSTSNEANPSTVGLPALEGAESSVSPAEPPVHGTIARSNPSTSAEPSSEHPASQPEAPESIHT